MDFDQPINQSMEQPINQSTEQTSSIIVKTPWWQSTTFIISVVVVLVLVGAGIALGILLTQNNNDKQVSPSSSVTSSPHGGKGNVSSIEILDSTSKLPKLTFNDEDKITLTVHHPDKTTIHKINWYYSKSEDNYNKIGESISSNVFNWVIPNNTFTKDASLKAEIDYEEGPSETLEVKNIDIQPITKQTGGVGFKPNTHVFANAQQTLIIELPSNIVFSDNTKDWDLYIENDNDSVKVEDISFVDVESGQFFWSLPQNSKVTTMGKVNWILSTNNLKSENHPAEIIVESLNTFVFNDHPDKPDIWITDSAQYIVKNIPLNAPILIYLYDPNIGSNPSPQITFSNKNK
jgi:hypothetical protein